MEALAENSFCWLIADAVSLVGGFAFAGDALVEDVTSVVSPSVSVVRFPPS